MHTAGDDLQDDFALDDLESDGLAAEVEETRDYLSEEENEQETPQSGPSTVQTADKKRKRREKLKERKKRKMAENPRPVVLVESIAGHSPSEISDYLFALQQKSFPDLSAIEIEDQRIPAAAIMDTTAWTGPRTLDQLVDFIMKSVPSLHTRLGQRSKANGSPTLIFVAGAALRVVDVTRILKTPKLRGEKGGEVAKLFAKHFKLSEHVTYLKRTKVGAAVGTPGRLGKLLCETDALAVSQTSHIMLDITFRDAKERNLLDIPETRNEVFQTVLGCPQVLRELKAGKIQLVLF